MEKSRESSEKARINFFFFLIGFVFIRVYSRPSPLVFSLAIPVSSQARPVQHPSRRSRNDQVLAAIAVIEREPATSHASLLEQIHGFYAAGPARESRRQPGHSRNPSHEGVRPISFEHVAQNIALMHVFFANVV